jgi:hypothetical protein
MLAARCAFSGKNFDNRCKTVNRPPRSLPSLFAMAINSVPLETGPQFEVFLR